jgi:hypothetical protein
MKSDDFDGDDCLVDGEPKHHVLAGDPVVMKLFDALAVKGVHLINAAFRIEEGSLCIDVWNAAPAKGQRMSANSLRKRVGEHMSDLRDIVLRGLELSLADVWDFQNDLVATVFVDVKKRSINVADIRELTFESDLPNPGFGIDL